MSFDFNSTTPIYLQIVDKIKRDVISGKIKAGERLPSVRIWALEMQVNPNTMQKALSELEEAGLIFTERTNGKFVTTDEGLIKKLRKEYAKELSSEFLENMLSLGFSQEEILQIISRSEK